MKIQQVFWVTFITMILFAGYIGYLIKPCKCPDLQPSKKITNEKIDAINNTDDNDSLRSLINRELPK